MSFQNNKKLMILNYEKNNSQSPYSQIILGVLVFKMYFCPKFIQTWN